MPVEQEVIVIYAGTQGYLDDVPINRVQEFQTAILQYVDASASGLRIVGRQEGTQSRN